MTVIGRCGDIVTCENGHEVCELLEDIDTTQTASADALGLWRLGQVKPSPGERIDQSSRCGICDARWAATSHHGRGATLHVNGGWVHDLPCTEPADVSERLAAYRSAHA